MGVPTRTWLRSWWWVLVIGVILAGIFVLSLVLVLRAASGVDAQPHWASLTGPIGDTFGGVLGPILSTAALVTTAYLAVWQPRKERAEERAAEVVAWIADTADRRHRGVVISNTSGSVAEQVYIEVVRSGAAQPLRDLEETVPPGTWFVPFLMTRGKEAQEGWKLPVAVDTSDGMTVRLNQQASEWSPLLETFTLRPHLPESENGVPLPHETLGAFSYRLHGMGWTRSDDGRISAERLTAQAKNAREAVRYTHRESAQVAGASGRVTAAIEELVRHTIDAVCIPSAEDAFELAKTEAQPVDPVVLPGARSVEHNIDRGNSMVFHLGTAGRTVRILGNAQQGEQGHSPAEINVLDGGGKKESALSKSAMEAGKEALRVGRLNGTDASFWLGSAAGQIKWLLVLRAVVAAAAQPERAQPEQIIPPETLDAEASSKGPAHAS